MQKQSLCFASDPLVLYSLPVIWFSLLDVGSYNFAAYISRKNVLLHNRSDLDDAMLDENDNSNGRYCCSHVGF